MGIKNIVGFKAELQGMTVRQIVELEKEYRLAMKQACELGIQGDFDMAYALHFQVKKAKQAKEIEMRQIQSLNKGFGCR